MDLAKILKALNPFQNMFKKRTIEERIKWTQFKLQHKYNKKKARKAYRAWKKSKDT